MNRTCDKNINTQYSKWGISTDRNRPLHARNRWENDRRRNSTDTNRRDHEPGTTKIGIIPDVHQAKRKTEQKLGWK